eukprot:NODE_384_length_9596_cov_0.282510.p5 type:complete len:130 gc:universal NODE_384_length_9596_cov_0.282510:1836-2225(+)
MVMKQVALCFLFLAVVFGDPCLSSSGKYFIPTDKGTPLLAGKIKAASYCGGASNKGIAGATSANNAELGKLILACKPENNRAWVDSWNGDTYQGAWLYLAPTYNGLPGTYTVVNDVAKTLSLAVICEKK